MLEKRISREVDRLGVAIRWLIVRLERVERMYAPTIACAKCGKTKAVAEYYSSDVTRKTCAECQPEAYRKRYKKNPKKEHLRVKRWKHSNPDTLARQGGRRYGRMARHSDGTLTREVVGDLYTCAQACPYCGRQLTPDSATLDHLDPLALGGLHGVSNVVACCRACNARKRARPFTEWLMSLAEPYRSRARHLYVRARGCAPEQESLCLSYGHGVAA